MVKGIPSVWRAVSSLGGHCVLLSQTWGAEGGRLAQGHHHSCGVSTWFLPHHSPKIPIGNLDVDSLCFFSPAPLPTPSPFSYVNLWRQLSLSLARRQLACLTHDCGPNDASLRMLSLLVPCHSLSLHASLKHPHHHHHHP